MQDIMRLAALTLLTIGFVGSTGCQSNAAHNWPENVYAGGNGAFGEDPSQPGAYRGSIPAVPVRDRTPDTESH
jgi:hypothetical protein